MVTVQVAQGDVILAFFPFLDVAGEKLRPALVFSNNNALAKSSTIILAPITTVLNNDAFTYQFSAEELKFANLHHNCILRLDRIVTLDRKLIYKKIGSLTSKTFGNVKKILLSQL